MADMFGFMTVLIQNKVQYLNFEFCQQYKLSSPIIVGNIMGVYSKKDSTVNEVSCGSNTLQCVLG